MSVPQTVTVDKTPIYGGPCSTVASRVPTRGVAHALAASAPVQLRAKGFEHAGRRHPRKGRPVDHSARVQRGRRLRNPLLVTDMMRTTVPLGLQSRSRGPLDVRLLGCMRRNTHEWKFSGVHVYISLASFGRWILGRPDQRYTVQVSLGRPVDPSGYWTTLVQFIGTRAECRAELLWLTEFASHQPDDHVVEVARQRWEGEQGAASDDRPS